MTKEVDPCRGCVCEGCAKSEKNGNTYGCPIKRCNKCEKGDVIYKLSYCNDSVALEERGELFTL